MNSKNLHIVLKLIFTVSEVLSLMNVFTSDLNRHDALVRD